MTSKRIAQSQDRGGIAQEYGSGTAQALLLLRAEHMACTVQKGTRLDLDEDQQPPHRITRSVSPTGVL